MATNDNQEVEIPRSKRGEGQWGLGFFEPLNLPERTKKDDEPLNVRKRILEKYSNEGFRSIDAPSLRSRLRWWGLYTQRRQGIPGGSTATAQPWELEDEFLMMRIRIAGGQLSSKQLRSIAWASERFGRDVADITDRQNVQLHWIRIEDVPRIWDAIEATGLTTCEACGDTPRNFLGCPMAGVDAQEIIDATPAIEETSRRYVGDPQFSNLPRKYKTSMSGCRHQCAQHEINCLSFVGVENNGKAGFDLWVGGGLGPNPHFAKRTGGFVEIEQIPDVWAAATSTFRDYGYRRARNKARLKFLIADWGAEKFREVMEQKYLGYTLPDSPEPPPSDVAQRDHIGVFDQKDGNHYVGFAPRAGRTSGHQLRIVADLADQYGKGRIRTTTQQKLVILDVPPDRVEELVDALETQDLRVKPSVFRQGTMACTGIEFCKLAITETKARAQWIYQELEDRLPDFDEELHINVNGCPNSCARFQVADIGLMGCQLPRLDGTKSDGYLIHLGGGLGENVAFGRKAKGVRVLAEELAPYIEALLRRYQKQKNGHKNFREFVHSLNDKELAEFAAPPAGA
ncbi:MAG: nitrite/sulfite reductase [Actinomycetota bacterium]